MKVCTYSPGQVHMLKCKHAYAQLKECMCSPEVYKNKKDKTKKPSKKPISVSSPTPLPESVVKRATRIKAKAPVFSKKQAKLMSERKFKEFEFKIKLNITVTKKEREMYAEQRVLRKLKRFLG